MKTQRFEALDSWRGLAALAVAVFHMNSYRPITTWGIVTNGYLFVDFFFVLSGFVIAANYHDRLLQGFGLGRFMLLRFGRLYPLHISVLCIYLASRVLRWRAGDPSAFATPTESVDTILVNLAMLQGFYIYDFLTWNYPSWSIGAELFAYFVFAGLLLVFKARVWSVLIGLVAVCAVALLVINGSMSTSNNYGLIRCLLGFSAGALAWRFYVLRGYRWETGTVAEGLILAVVVSFISVAGITKLSLLAPLVFATAILIFAGERGGISCVLRSRPLVFLGTISYSIYMVHAFTTGLLRVASDSAVRKLPALGWLFDGLPFYALYLVLVVLVSWGTYSLIEAPARAWFQRLARPVSLKLKMA